MYEEIKPLRTATFTAGPIQSNVDPLTLTLDPPTSFRVGECFALPENKVQAEVLLLWRTNDKNMERKHTVELMKVNDAWLINKITPERMGL